MTNAEPLMSRDDVAKLFDCHRKTTYKIKGLELCYAIVPGIKRKKFDPVKVRALYNRVTKRTT